MLAPTTSTGGLTTLSSVASLATVTAYVATNYIRHTFQKCFEKEFSLQKNVGLMFSTLNLQFKTKHKNIAFRNLTEVAFQQVFDFLYPLNLKYGIDVL